MTVTQFALASLGIAILLSGIILFIKAWIKGVKELFKSNKEE